MKKELALAPQTKLQPPPKKSEVIDALTRIEVEKRNKEERDGVERRKVLQKECEEEITMMALADTSAYVTEIHWGWGYSGGKLEGIQVRLDIQDKQFPHELKKKIKEMLSLPSRYCEVQFNSVRKEISALVNQVVPKDERVTAMLADDATRSSLEKMLAIISK